VNLPQIFNFNGNDVRTVSMNGEPWFVLNDVVSVLGLSNSRMVKDRLTGDVSAAYTIPDALGRPQETTIINEDGLYDTILESRKPEARAFRKWITSEVIPSIRKHGAYMSPEVIEQTILNPDYIIKLATRLKEEQTARIAAENKLDSQRSLVAFAETCLDSDRNMLVREVAKLASKEGVMIGQQRLYNKLREWGMVFQQRTEPTQRAMEMGIFEVIKGVKLTPKGARDWETSKVTPKGQVYIVERLKRESQQQGA
jgi:anti-repressor protein